MTKKTDLPYSWTATPGESRKIPARDLEVLQDRFGGRLNIERTREGGIVITAKYPDREALAEFMAKQTSFSPQRLERKRKKIKKS